MEKRRREGSTEEDSTCRDQCSSIDRISMLPDELLVLILSFLTFKEAAAASIVSCRWRYLWTFDRKLDFDGLESLNKLNFREGEGERESQLEEERVKYVGWVNHVIKLHKVSTIHEFRVKFSLNKAHKTDIDNWLTYALSKKVQILEVYLLPNCDEYYSFPDELLHSEGRCDSIYFNYLKKIIMYHVNVNGEALEFFLHNCPLLEHLSVDASEELSSLRVIGPFPSFKRLEITFCGNLISVEIRNANLVYLKYWGGWIHFLLENVPLLVEIYVGGVTLRLEDVRLLFQNCLPQLEIFTIERFGTLDWVEAKKLYSAVKEMSNLKQLIVRASLGSNSLKALTKLIRPPICLQRFVVQPPAIHEYERRKFKKIARTYTCLKEVEFLGYHGSQYELELVIHFLENAVGLEKIIINLRKLGKSPMIIMKEIAARICSREQLTAKVLFLEIQ